MEKMQRSQRFKDKSQSMNISPRVESSINEED